MGQIVDVNTPEQLGKRRTGGLGRSAAIVAALASALQLAYLVDSRSDPTFDTPIVDAATYHAAASRFADGEALSTDAFWQPPLFPLALGIVYHTLGVKVVAARVLLALLAVASCLLVWRIGQRCFSDRVGLIAGLMTAFCGPFVFFSTQLLPVGLGVFLSLASFNLWLNARERGGWWRWGAFGLIGGLATITVPNAAVIPLIAIFELLVSACRGRSARSALVGCMATIIGAAIPIGAVTLRNHQVSGDWVLISTNAGINFYIGNNPDSDRTVAVRPGEPWRRLNRLSYRGGARTRTQQSDYFIGRGLAYMKENPVDFVRGLARKALQFVNAREIPRNLDPYIHRDYSHLLSLLMWRAGPFAFPMGLLAPLAMWGWLHGGFEPETGERPRRDRLRLGLVIVAYAASVIMFFTASRYRLPAMVLAMPFAAAGAIELVRLLARKATTTSSLRQAASLIAFAASVVLVNLPIRVAIDATNFRAELAMCVGDAHMMKGDEAEGERMLRNALTLDPHYADAATRLAGALAERGEFDEAERLLRDARTWDKQSVDLRLLYGRIMRERGRLDEALSLFEEAVAVDSTAPDARTTLAEQLGNMGRVDDAIEQYRKALDLVEKRGPVLVRLGDLLRQRGDHAEAIEHYRRGLWLIEPDAETLGRIALYLATCPDAALRVCDSAIDMAEHLVNTVDDVDAAVWGDVAAVYSECGRLHDALRWARHAVGLAVSHGDEELAAHYRNMARLYEQRLADDGSHIVTPSEQPAP